MKFNCEICNYSTDNKYCYDKHLTTKIHLKKVDHVTKSLKYLGKIPKDSSINLNVRIVKIHMQLPVI